MNGNNNTWRNVDEQEISQGRGYEADLSAYNE